MFVPVGKGDGVEVGVALRLRVGEAVPERLTPRVVVAVLVAVRTAELLRVGLSSGAGGS